MPILTDNQQAVINALQPVIIPLPLKLKHYKQIVSTPDRKIKQFINPITQAIIKNNYANRKRVFNKIKDLNEKAKERNDKITEIKEKNKFEEKTVLIQVLSAITVYLGVDIQTRGITNIDELFKYLVNLFEKTKNKGGFKLSSARVYFEDEEGNKTYRGISNDYFANNSIQVKEAFIERINDFISGENLNAGSDAIGENKILNFNHLQLHFLNVAQAQGKNDLIIFENVNVNETKDYKKNDCVNNCMKYLIDYYNLEYPNMYQLNNINDLQHLLKYITFENLPIRVISNVIKVNEIKGDPNFKTLIDKNKKKFKKLLYILSDCKCKIKELYIPKNVDYKFTLVYCPITSHIDIIKNNTIKILDDVYINENNEIFKEIEGDLTKIYNHKDIYEYNIEVKNICHLSYIFFDYETITDWSNNNVNTEYAISFFEITQRNFTNYAYNLNEEEIIFREEDCKNRIGFDCSNKFLDWIRINELNKRFVFVSFNGSNFDNLILINKMMRDERFKVEKPLYVGNSLLDCKINGRHTFYDLRRHLMGSLKKNCKDFNIPEKYCKIELEMGHTEIQNYYNTHTKEEFLEYMKNNEELTEYNNNDVYSLAYLFIKYYNVYSNIKGYEEIQNKFTEYRTISSIIYKIFSMNINDKKILLPKLTLQQYEDLQKYKTAGRVEIFGDKPIFLSDEEIVSMDVCSLYPYIMSILNVYYPCGEIKETNIYIKDKIGFYYCNIDQRALKTNNLPNIIPEKTKTANDWSSNKILNNYLISNISIELLKSYENIGVKCEVLNGFYFTDKIKGCELFKPILVLMGLKNIQDDYKNIKSDKYNSSLRETLKLLMNALSGKVIEGIHLDQTIINNDSLDDLVKLYAKKENGKINNLCVIDCIDNNLILSYKRNIEDLINKQRPIYLGCLIYENARKYMYENIYSKIGLNKMLYTDTDCGKFRKTDFDIWAIWAKNQPVKHWREIEDIDKRYKEHKLYNEKSKVFGSFENELKPNNVFYALQKKFWLVANKNDKGEITYIKTRFKGINPNSLIIPDTINDIVLRTYKNEGVFDLTENITLIDDNKKICNWIYENNKKFIIGGDFEGSGVNIGCQIKFFDELYKNGSSNVLVNNFQKVVKNSKKNVEVGEKERYNNNTNSIMCKYMLKTITL